MVALVTSRDLLSPLYKHLVVLLFDNFLFELIFEPFDNFVERYMQHKTMASRMPFAQLL